MIKPPMDVLFWYLLAFLALGLFTRLWCRLYGWRRESTCSDLYLAHMQTAWRRDMFVMAVVVACCLGIVLFVPTYLAKVELPIPDYVFVSVHNLDVRISTNNHNALIIHDFNKGLSNDGCVIQKKGP